MKKIRFFALTLALCMLVCVFASCSKNDSEVEIPNGFRLASEDSADYYLFVPTGWTVDITSTATSAYVSPTDPASVSVMCWSLSNSDSTLDDWWTSYLPDFEKVYTDFNLETEENVLVDSLAAKNVIYTGTIADVQYKFRQTAVIKNAVVYVLTYTSTASGFPDHTDDFDSIVENFKLK